VPVAAAAQAHRGQHRLLLCTARARAVVAHLRRKGERGTGGPTVSP
jgi:hypothetical protein